MPFLDDAQPAGLAPQVAAPLEIDVPTPPLGRLLGAAFERENTLSSLRSWMYSGALADRAPRDPSFDPFANIAGYEDDARAFVFDNTPEEVDRTKQRIDRERRNAELLDQGGALGWLASIGAGTFDPVNLIPFGQGFAVARSGRALSRLAGAGRGAVRVGAGAAVGQAAQEAALQATQISRPWEESAVSVGLATVVGSCLGGAVGVFR